MMMYHRSSDGLESRNSIIIDILTPLTRSSTTTAALSKNMIRSQIPILIKCILDRFPQSGSLGPRGGYSTDASDQIARYAPLIISLLCSLEWNTGELLGLFSPSSYLSYRWLFLFWSFCVRLCVCESVCIPYSAPMFLSSLSVALSGWNCSLIASPLPLPALRLRPCLKKL